MLDKRKLQFIGSVILLIIGILGILTFIGLLVRGEDMTRWMLTLLLSVILVIKEIIVMIHYKNS